jgi:NADPH2:quinone reductase
VAANHLLVKNYAVIGLYWARYLAEGPDVVRRAAEEVFSLLAAGRLDPLISDRGRIADAPEWAARVAAGRTTGKVVLTW